MQAYPLAWPPGWPRTASHARQKARFDTTVSKALAFMESEIAKLGGKNLVVSSNCTLGQMRPSDPGVCAYFHYQGMNAAIPCDRWLSVESNVQAIAKTVEAMRGIERWGAKNMVKAAFTGFAALPAPSSSKPWREVLGLTIGGRIEAEAAYKSLRSMHHPDKNGDPSMFDAVQKAWEQAKMELT